MKQHTVKGANIMRPVSQLKNMLPGIELHHEHMDGRGYPYGLQGPQIPLMARIHWSCGHAGRYVHVLGERLSGVDSAS